MRVLIVAKEGNRNTFVLNLKSALAKFSNVDCSIDKFWNSSDTYQIIHLQWPELLSFMISRKSFSPTNQRLKKIKKRLIYWKDKGTKLIITRHNILPHHSSRNYEILYGIIHEYIDGIIHFGSFSQNDFIKRYPHLNPKQIIIPHGWYDNIINKCTRKEARDFLDISENTFVVLAFGAIRNNEEEQMLFKSFEKLPIENKLMLIPRGYFSNENLLYRLMSFLSLKPYKKLLQSKAKQLIEKKIIWGQKFIEENHIQYYFNAADILIIPRIDTLNSGNIPLGFSFKKVVVGPLSGNIGSILDETSNPTFDPTSINSIIDAMIVGKQLSNELKGNKNYDFAEKNWNWHTISKQHQSFFELVLSQ